MGPYLPLAKVKSFQKAEGHANKHKRDRRGLQFLEDGVEVLFSIFFLLSKLKPLGSLCKTTIVRLWKVERRRRLAKNLRCKRMTRCWVLWFLFACYLLGWVLEMVAPQKCQREWREKLQQSPLSLAKDQEKGNLGRQESFRNNSSTPAKHHRKELRPHLHPTHTSRGLDFYPHEAATRCASVPPHCSVGLRGGQIGSFFIHMPVHKCVALLFVTA